jgi:hypothetical protein
MTDTRTLEFNKEDGYEPPPELTPDNVDPAMTITDISIDKSGTTITATIDGTSTTPQPVGNSENILSSMVNRVKSALQRGNSDIIAFKVNTKTRSWVAIWSNNFEDRDGEIFTAKAIDDYIARVDMGIVPPPELWVHHTPGTRLGVAQHVGRIGSYAVAFGSFDDTPEVTKAMHRLAGMKNLGMSHGYTYNPRYKKGRIYHQFNTFELSVLHRQKAANAYTSFQEIEMKSINLSPSAEEDVKAVWGDEWTEKLKTALVTDSEAKELLGIAQKNYNDFASASDVEADTSAEATKAAAEIGAKAFGDMLIDLIEAQSESATLETKMIKHVQGLEAQIVGLKAIVEALQTAVDLKPRSAADSKETVDQKATAEDKAGFMGKKDPFWNTVVG